jgi:toxin-antitoxin system PIN domain toxin
VIAVDTNILVYAHRRDSAFHGPAAGCVRGLAESPSPWAIPWPCLHEFVAIVTSPRIFKMPTPWAGARTQVEAWLGSPSLRLLAEEEGYWTTLADLIGSSRVTGAKVHDARIAALAIHHGVSELYSADRDFSRFGILVVRNPL